MLLRSIISQQLSNKAADSIQRKLYCLTSPEPSSLLLASPEQLRAAGLSKNKIHSLHTLSKAIVSGELVLENLRLQSDQQVIQTLSGYPGIGPWTAEMFLIFGLGRPDVLALADLGLRRAAQILYDLENRPSAKEFAQLGQNWQPYRTIASWYLWRVIDGSGGAWAEL